MKTSVRIPLTRWWVRLAWLQEEKRQFRHEFELVEYAQFHHYCFWFFRVVFNDWSADA